MKRSTNIRVISALGLIALAGAGTLRAAEDIGGGQEQARLLLSHEVAPSGGQKYGAVPRSSSAGKTIAADGLGQAREMILGRDSAKGAAAESGELRVAAARRERRGAKDPQDLARQMIVWGHSRETP